MKKVLKTVLVFALAVVFGTNLSWAQERAGDEPRVSPNASVSQTIGTTVVTVTYGRPGVRDRTIFGDLEPWNEVWRTGANEATTITFSDNVDVEGETVEAGTYGLFTIPREEGSWTVILNRTANQWGAFDYDEGEDALRVEADSESSVHVEQMMIYFEDVTDDSGSLVIHWGETRLPVRITSAG